MRGLESYEILTAEKVDRKVKEVDEDEARKTFHMHGLERKSGAIEIFAHVLVVDELAAPVIRPLVIGADESVEGATTRIA